MTEDPEIHLTVHSGIESRHVSLRARDSLRSVMREFPNCSQFKAIHNNSVVGTGFSLAFLGIEDGAHIYTIPQPPPEPPSSKPEQIPIEKLCDRETFRRAFGELHGPDYDEELCRQCFSDCDTTICREVARLKDRFFDRVEGTIKAHRKMLRNFFGCTKKERESSDSEEKEKEKEKEEEKDKEMKKKK
jgi:hypothetical protein